MITYYDNLIITILIKKRNYNTRKEKKKSINTWLSLFQ